MHKCCFRPLFLSVIGLCLCAHYSPVQAKEIPCTIGHAVVNDAKSDYPQVSTAELRQILKNKTATVFDARPYREYCISHIPGALSLAAKPGVEKAVYVSDVNEVNRILKGKKDSPVVLYCNGMY